jgi:hypothetical protein
MLEYKSGKQPDIRSAIDDGGVISERDTMSEI